MQQRDCNASRQPEGEAAINGLHISMHPRCETMYHGVPVRGIRRKVRNHMRLRPNFADGTILGPAPDTLLAKGQMPESNQPIAAMFASYPSLRGRAVLVTGGATGIGSSIVTHFARQGARVAFFDVQDEPAHQLIESVKAESDTPPVFLHCDLTNIEELQSSMERAIAILGGVDVMVNNAGNDRRHKIEEVTPEYWDNCMQQNLRHYF